MIRTVLLDDPQAWLHAQGYNYIRQRWMESIALGLEALRHLRTGPDGRACCCEMLCDAAMQMGDPAYTTSILEDHLRYVGPHARVAELLGHFLQSCTVVQAQRVLGSLAWTAPQFNELGMSLFAQRQFDAAERLGQCWEAQYPSETMNSAATFLPWVYWRQLRYEKALTAFGMAYKRLKHPDLLAGQALVLGFMGRYEESAARYLEVERMRPLCGDDFKCVAMALFGAGHIQESMEYHERRIETPPFATLAPGGLPRWEGQSLTGRLLVLSDPGWSWGDHLMYARYLALLGKRVRHLRIQADTALHAVLRQALPLAEVVSEINAKGCEAFVWLMSLPVVLGLWTAAGESLPWLSPDEARVRHWKWWWEERAASATRRTRIGLCWRGNPHTYHDRFRSLAFDDLMPLFAGVPSVDWTNLQLGASERPEPVVLDALNSRWIDPMPSVSDFMDTATIATMMDHVVTIDSAVAHLCGSAGVSTTVLVPFWGEWRWQNTDRSIWYPYTRLVRTSPDSTFRQTLQQVASELVGVVG